MFKLREIQKKINISGEILYGEPMSIHTTFKTGGPADIFALPRNLKDLEVLIQTAADEGIPWFVMGGGANILVSDKGIRGLVIGTGKLDGFSLRGPVFKASSGLDMSLAAWETGAAGLAGLHSFYAMPGSLGGAVWMNARCYDHSISEFLRKVTLLSPDGTLSTEEIRPEDFDYKVSPYQHRDCVIIEAEFHLRPEDSRTLTLQMEEYRKDRREKGHFAAPSAGSVFKNNRAFGKPSGQIIDQAGLKGLTLGGARVSENHGNLIFNSGKASSADIRGLIDLVKSRVYGKTGLLLEEEILYIGEW